MEAPSFNTKFACIVDRQQVELAAVIASYLHEPGTFLSVFEYGLSTTERQPGTLELRDEHAPSRVRSEEVSIKISNAIQKIGSIEYLILAGLDDRQKSYLARLHEYTTLEIDSLADVESMLGGIAYDKVDYLAVHPDDLLWGLFMAGKSGRKLRLDVIAPPLPRQDEVRNGVIVIENTHTVSAVSAINYALSIAADINVISEFSGDNLLHSEQLIKGWQQGDRNQYEELMAMMFSQIGEIDFTRYRFATFFTAGVPFSLILKNELPITYVYLDGYTTLFIVDNIFYERVKPIGSAIVFSPLVFGEDGVDEETQFVIDLFGAANFYVKELTGKAASSYNIDMHVKEYPFDILHICSHGGEVKGYSNVVTFTDRDGNSHVIEYDDVISFYPNPNRQVDLIKVETKHIWRKFDGMVWKSKELKSKQYPHYVFVDMQQAISDRDDQKGKYKGTPKSVVPDSCAIACDVFVYQAMFDMIAGFHASPVIFNNTCWSWSGIADSFLSAGARGYVGTLWAVENNVARQVAEEFYQNIFTNTIAESLHHAMTLTKGTHSEGIYVYWGLHFSTLGKPVSMPESRTRIAELMIRGFHNWRDHAAKLPDGFSKKSSLELAEWDYNELLRNFKTEASKVMAARRNAAKRND